MFIDVLDGVAKTPEKHAVGEPSRELEQDQHSVGEPSRKLEQDQHTGVIQRMELAEWIVAYRVALAPLPTGVPQVPPKWTVVADIQNKNLEDTPWLLHKILDNCLKDEGQHDSIQLGFQLYGNLGALRQHSG